MSLSLPAPGRYWGAVYSVCGYMHYLLFCAYTSHTEVVCSIKNRDEILGLLFCVLAMQTALIVSRKVSSFLFLLAMLCKSAFLPFDFLIPLPLILFTESSFALLMALTVLLSIASYAVLDINPPYFKLWLVVVLLAGVATSYLFVKNLISIITVRAWSASNKPEMATPEVPFSGLKNWLSEFNL